MNDCSFIAFYHRSPAKSSIIQAILAKKNCLLYLDN